MKSFFPTIRESDPTGMEKNLCGSRRFPGHQLMPSDQIYTSHDLGPPNGGDLVREIPEDFREGKLYCLRR